MRMVLLLLVVVVFACEQHDATSAALDADASGVRRGSQYFHARYLFSHAEYEDVEVAVRVERRNGYPAVLQVKDLSPQAVDNMIEQAALRKNGCNLSFIGTSTGVEGGEYTGELQQMGGEINNCCGRMTFVPAIDTSLTFRGKKLATLSAAEWAQLVEDDEDTGAEEPSGDSSDTEEPSTSGTEPDTDDSDSGGGNTQPPDSSDGDDTQQPDGDGGGDNTQQPDDDGGDTQVPDEEEDQRQRFYALGTSTILLSRASLLPPQRGKTKKYLMQVVIEKSDSGIELPPVVHIKRVSSAGRIADVCLSLLYDEQDVSSGVFSFSYGINTTSVREMWGYSDMYGEDAFVSVGVVFDNGPGQSISYTALRAGAGTNNTVPLVQEKYVERRKSEWGIRDDIIAAFEDSDCDGLGHNRTCVGCIMQ